MPFLFVVGNDPVELGLAQSLGRPGGSATGIVFRTLAIGPKRLDLLRQIAPKAKTFGALVNPAFPQAAFQKREPESTVRALDLTMHFADASTESALGPAFDALVKQGVEALVVTADPFFDMMRSEIVTLAAERKLPAIYHHREYTDAGGLMSYGISSWTISGSFSTSGLHGSSAFRSRPPSTPLPTM